MSSLHTPEEAADQLGHVTAYEIRGMCKRGTVSDRSSGAKAGALKREAVKRGEQPSLQENYLPKATDYFLSANEQVDTYAMTDSATDLEFETALDTAKARARGI